MLNFIRGIACPGGVIALALALVIAINSSALAEGFSLRKWLGMDPVATGPEEAGAVSPDEHSTFPPKETTAAVTAQASDLTPDYQQLRALILGLPGERRRAVLSQPEQFQQLIRDELAARSVVAMALATGVHKRTTTMLHIQRQVHQVLREQLRAQYLQQHIPEEFPTETEMRVYYDLDPSRFYIPQRMHVWQIFFPVTNLAQEQETLVTAEAVLADILTGELSFQEAAIIHSEHLPSRYRRGYVGLVDLVDIDAKIKPALLELPPGKPGGPIQGLEGYHILQRGEVHSEIQTSFERVREVVRQQMLNERREELYTELTQQAAQAHPFKVDGTLVKRWWTDMRAEAGL